MNMHGKAEILPDWGKRHTPLYRYIFNQVKYLPKEKERM